MATQIIVLNGGSSSGKSGIVRCLQAVLTGPWLGFGCDSFIDALPATLQTSDAGIVIEGDGTVSVGGGLPGAGGGLDGRGRGDGPRRREDHHR